MRLAALRHAVSTIAFFYPAYWTAMLIVYTAPGLTDWNNLTRTFFLSPLSVGAGFRTRLWLGVALSVIVAAACVAIGLRRRRVIAGLAIACLGHVAMGTPWTMWVFLDRAPIEAKIACAGYFLVMTVGLIWMAPAESSWTRRLTANVVGFVTPLGIFASLSMRQRAWIVVLPAAGAALIAALWRRPAIADVPGPGWRPVATGLAASVLLAGAAHAGGQVLRSARSAAQVAERNSVMAAVPKPNPAQPYGKLFFQKGVNFTAEGPDGYSPASAARMLDQLREKGVTAVALVPYGFQRRDDTSIRYEGSWERAELIADVTALAHQRGMKVLLKPQIWTGRGFPGDIFYEKAEDRARWFEQYRGFLEYWARHAAKMHADLFCVGVEFVKMTQYEAEWRSLIARARALYPGPLVYGATQGPEFETIRFWDALDYIGLNSYYPLPDDLSATGVLRKVEEVQRRFKRPVLLTEAGFTSMKAPHRAPWDETRREISLDEQARCYESLFKAFYRQPWFQGFYWWKVGSNGHGGPQDGSFTPWKKPAMDVVARWYQQGGR